MGVNYVPHVPYHPHYRREGLPGPPSKPRLTPSAFTSSVFRNFLTAIVAGLWYADPMVRPALTGVPWLGTSRSRIVCANDYLDHHIMFMI